jgi:tRNA (adenine22-N1)-methyltransferase
MNLSERLNCISKIIPKCKCLADIGTDHGYIPIYTVSNGICDYAIASDIKKGPIIIAKKNICKHNLENKIETRVGPGLSVLKIGEADVILICGMGGNLISEILRENKLIAESADCLILQPVQYPEELRKYLIKSNFCIVDEELAFEDNKYYHIIKVKKGKSLGYDKEVYFYTGLQLIKKKHPLINDYIDFKINQLNNILEELNNSTQAERRFTVEKLKKEFEDVNTCLKAVEK